LDWIEYFVRIVNVVKLKSKDTSTKCGALIVGEDNELVSTGYNSLPRGVDDSKLERYDRPVKYYWFEHAERNAIYNAARVGVQTKGCSLYLSADGPCVDCARAIINAGIKTIYCNSKQILDPEKWAEQLRISKEMLDEAGVEIIKYDVQT